MQVNEINGKLYTIGFHVIYCSRDNLPLHGKRNYIRLQDSIIGCCEIEMFLNNLN